MMKERDLRQVRYLAEKDSENAQYKRFPICGKGGHSGWFCPCERARHSDLSEELGLGITLYFKTLKQLVIFMILCTLLSIPSFAFYWTGRQGSNVWKDSKVFFSTFTLGNLGQSSNACTKEDFNQSLLPWNGLNTEIFCPFGVFDDFNVI
jgi:hypothetical protein